MSRACQKAADPALTKSPFVPSAAAQASRARRPALEIVDACLRSGSQSTASSSLAR